MGLSALLFIVYVLAGDALGKPLIYILQALIVGGLLAAALWVRRARGPKSLLGGVEASSEADPGAEDLHLPKAS